MSHLRTRKVWWASTNDGQGLGADWPAWAHIQLTIQMNHEDNKLGISIQINNFYSRQLLSYHQLNHSVIYPLYL